MATMSIGKAWEEAVAFVAREATLLFPVALLFVALPGLILQEMTRRNSPPGRSRPPHRPCLRFPSATGWD